MKTNHLLLVIGLMLAIMALYHFFFVQKMESKLADNQISLPVESTATALKVEEKHEEKHAEEHHLIEAMKNFQWFGNKLWFAANAKNWELANFYVHELEETAEEVTKNKIMDDGVDISTLMQTMAMPKIEGLEKAVKEKNEILFLENYKALIQTCNACHQSSGKSFIKIKTPDKPITDMQEF